jgi:hypothetical protein
VRKRMVLMCRVENALCWQLQAAAVRATLEAMPKVTALHLSFSVFFGYGLCV